MKRLYEIRNLRLALVALLWIVTIAASGCTPSEEDETIAAIQDAMTTLTANRSLVEQMGRDVKSNVNPAAPAYSDLMESYEEARDSYNNFLDTVAASSIGRSADAGIAPAMDEAQTSTADFIQAATRALDPTGNMRGLSTHRAIKLPSNLADRLQHLPKSERKRLVQQFGSQVHWRSWGQL
jgi:hypothetical protein